MINGIDRFRSLEAPAIDALAHLDFAPNDEAEMRSRQRISGPRFLNSLGYVTRRTSVERILKRLKKWAAGDDILRSRVPPPVVS
jgi:hypothetical protein